MISFSLCAEGLIGHSGKRVAQSVEQHRGNQHGCIRLSRPIEFAYEISANIPGWSKELVDAVLATDQTTRAILPDKIPVHLMYGTAFRGDAGTIEFRPDVYGRDRKLYNALFAQPTS